MAFLAPHMLATGDYGGRICVWNIFTGERRCTLTHEAPEYQKGVEQLLLLRPPTPQASPILLSCGGAVPSSVLVSKHRTATQDCKSAWVQAITLVRVHWWSYTGLVHAMQLSFVMHISNLCIKCRHYRPVLQATVQHS